MIKATYSIKIPNWKIFHFRKGRKVGESRPTCFKGFAHYDRQNRPIGTSIRNFIGELNHYNNAGNCIGYSRRERPWRIVHYDRRGECLGKSFIFLWILIVHSGFPLFSPASATRRNIPYHRWIPYLVYNILLPSQLVRTIIDYIERVLELWAQEKEY